MGLKQGEQGQNWGRPEKERIPGGEQSFRAESMTLFHLSGEREGEITGHLFVGGSEQRSTPCSISCFHLRSHPGRLI